MFGNLFGTKKKPPAGGPAKGKKADISGTIQKLKGTQETLDKREAHLDKQIAKLQASAKKKMKNKDKKGALFDLKKKKMLTKQLDGIQAKKLNLETQIMALDEAQMNTEAFTSIQQATNALRITTQQVNPEKVDDVMDQLQEAMDEQAEINDAISQPIGQDFDEDDLMAELDDLEQEDADLLADSMPDVALDEPKVPTHKVKAKEEVKEADDELADLEAMLA